MLTLTVLVIGREATRTGLTWLLLMLVMSMSDYVTRGRSQSDWGNGVGAVNHVGFVTPPPQR